MSLLLTGKTAVVTGGASGFGREICRTFARNGADVIVADIRSEPREGGRPTHELVREETDRRAEYVSCDVREPDDLAVAVEAADELGGIDIMVNNAGIFRVEEFLGVTEDEYDRMMDINAKGVFFGAQAAARKLVDNGGGAIINMSSVAGMNGTDILPTYCMSKGAVRLLTYALAAGLGSEGVRVNAIHPGISKTQLYAESELGNGIRGRVQEAIVKRMIPQGRFGEPTDVANAALFLASDLSSYVNGESLLVDGGFTTTR